MSLVLTGKMFTYLFGTGWSHNIDFSSCTWPHLDPDITHYAAKLPPSRGITANWFQLQLHFRVTSLLESLTIERVTPLAHEQTCFLHIKQPITRHWLHLTLTPGHINRSILPLRCLGTDLNLSVYPGSFNKVGGSEGISVSVYHISPTALSLVGLRGIERSRNEESVRQKRQIGCFGAKGAKRGAVWWKAVATRS